MANQDFWAKLQSMTMERKLTLLSATEKAYIHGYIDRVLFEQQRAKKRGDKE
jgi:Fe-S cluster biosynthesis and repair protein YggX